MKDRSPKAPRRRVFVALLLAFLIFGLGFILREGFPVSANSVAAGPKVEGQRRGVSLGQGIAPFKATALPNFYNLFLSPVATTDLVAGDIAIVSYNSENFPAANQNNKFAFVLLRPIGSLTVISFTDQSWNGSAFTVSGTDSTITFTAGSDLAAGTVVATNNPAFSGMFSGSLNLDPNGDTIFAYQGSAATPTFLYAIEFADGNNTFNGSLANTGLTPGTTAVGVTYDNARFVGQSTQIKQTQLAKIGDSVQWSGHDGEDIGGTIYDDTSDTSISGPLNNPDMQLFVVNNGGGQSDAIVRVDNDEAANVGTYLTRLFRDNPAITRLEDIAFDVEDGVWFAPDNEGTDITRILKGNIADLVSGTSNPTITVVFDYPNNSADSNDDKFIQGIEIDTAANRVFFTLGEIGLGHEFRSMDYNGLNLRNWGLIDLVLDPTFGFAGGIEDFVIDVPQNTAYFSYVLVNAGAGQVLHNYVVRLTAPLNAAAPSPAVENYAIVNIANAGAPPPGYSAGRIPDHEGSIRGMDYDAATNTIWFMTGRLGAGGTGGIFKLNLNTLNYTEVWQQPSNNSHNTPQAFPTTLLVDIEVDSIGGRYYVTSLNSTDTPSNHDGGVGINDTDENGSRIWSDSMTSPTLAGPTFFASMFENTANGAGAGMEINYAPTLSVTDAGSTYTEAAGNPSPLSPSVAVISASTVSDVDQTVIKGATVAITAGFIPNIDTLTFTNSGGITGAWTAATGVLSFTGNATFAQYQTVLNSVRFTASGDNPTAYGTNFLRTFSFSVTDGLAWSDLGISTVDVVGINDAPVNVIVGGTARSVNEDTNLSVTGLSVGDVDANPASQQLVTTLSVLNGTLTVASAGGAAVSGSTTGTVTLTGTSTQINTTLGAASNILYRGNQDYFGPDTLTFKTNDQGNTGNDPGISGTGTSEEDSDTINITVIPVNDAPTASGETLSSIAEDSGQRTIPFADLTGNDSTGPANESSQTLIVKTVSSPVGGTVLISGGNVLFTPTLDYNGPASFQYTVEDNGQSGSPLINDFKVSAPAVTASFTITEVNDAPTATADPISSVAEDSAQRTITIASLLSNDLKGPANESGQTLTFVSAGNPVGGTVTSDAINVYFTPAADFNGPASFDYTITDNGTTNGANDFKTGTGTVSFTITEVNDAPTANGDALISVAEDSGVRTIAFATLTGNDSKGPANENGQTLIVKTVSNPIGGTVSIVATNVLFTPTANYNGPASFDYTVEDNGTTNGVAAPLTSAGSATVSFTITEVNDAPTATNDGLSSVAEDSGQRTISFSSLTSNDSTGPANENTQTLIVKTVSNPIGGTVSILGTDVLFTPTADFNGAASFDYTVEDNGTTNGAADPLTSATAATVSFTITEINDAPTANNDTLTDVAEDSGQRTIPFTDLTTNDNRGAANESGQALIVKTVSNPVGGTVSILGTDVLFTPTAEYQGPASFDYTVEDNGTTNGAADPLTSAAAATASFTVTEVNDPPSFTKGDDQTVSQDAGPQTVNPWATNISPGPGETGQTLTFNVSVGSTTGTLAFSSGPAIDAGTGALTYTTAPGTSGTANISVTLSDNGATGAPHSNTSAAQTFVITVNAENSPPVNTVPGALTILQNTALTFTGSHVISVADADAAQAPSDGVITVSLTATNGILMLSGTAGLSFNSGADNSAAMSFDGTVPNINAALNGMTFTPTSGFTGAASVQIVSDDQGKTGPGGVKTDTDTVQITVVVPSAIYINEVLFDPPGTDAPNEYIELRGPAGEAIPQGTYFVAIEGDNAENPGDVQTIINLSGLSFGTNGFLVLLQNGNTYTTAAGATVVTSTTTGFGGLGLPSLARWSADSAATDIEHGSVSFMLIQTGAAPTLADDIDSDNNGLTDGTVFPGWSVRDSINAMNGSANAYAYGAFGYRNTAGSGSSLGTEVIVTFIPSYVGRVCDSTGATAADWLASGVLGGTAPNWTLGSSTETEPAGFAGNPLDHIGTTNFVNTAPVNTVPGAQSTSEDTAFIFTGPTQISIADSDAGSNSVEVTLTATNGTMSLSGTGSLTFTPPGAGNDGTNDVTMVFTGTVSSINTALNNLTFTPTSNYAGAASVQIVTNDQGSTGGAACSTTQSDTDTVNITVNGANDAPVLDNTGNMFLNSIPQDVPAGSNTGTLVSDIIASAGGDRITDPDAGALEGIAVNAVNNANGTWEFSTNGGGIWTAFGSPTDGIARLLASDANTRVRFQPTLGFSGTVNPGITFRAWDRTTGTNGATGNASINGGATAFSTDTETATITVSSTVSVQDASVAEPSTGTTNMVFTVTLNAPAPPGGAAVNFTTADEAAGPGKAVAGTCGSGGDYTTTSGTINFAVGQQVKSISVPVCADTNLAEPDETFLVNLSVPVNATIADGTATGTITAANTAGAIQISELRTSGPGGGTNEFVEIYNNSNSPHTVAASDASAGYGVYIMGADCNATPILVGTIPNGTVLPPRGHYLFVGSAYSLANYGGTGAAAGNATLTSDIPNDANVAIFSTADVSKLSSLTRYDAVGFGLNTGSNCDLLREGSNLPAVSGSVTEHSFFRKLCDFTTGCTTPGLPKDTNNNATDFLFADTQGTLIPGVPRLLGAPGPENLASPLKRDATIGVVVLDASVAPSSPPNRTRDLTSNPGNSSTFGTLAVRRRIVNNTGANVTRLRFRIVEMTTFQPTHPSLADLRALTSTLVTVSGVNDPATCFASTGSASTPCSVTVQGTTLEQPPTQTIGGGLNATLAAGTITTGTPLAPGASVNVNFLLGVQQTGTFRFLIIVEALP